MFLTMGDAARRVSTRCEDAEVIISTLSMFADYFGFGILGPLLPFWLQRNEFSLRWVGIIVAAQYGAVIVGLPAIGSISQKCGMKPTLTVVMILDTVLFAATGFPKTPLALCLIRIGAGLCAPQGLAIAWITQLSDDTNLPTRMGLVAASIHVGILAGAVVGGLLGPSRWTLACIVSALPCLGIAVWLLARIVFAGSKKVADVADAQTAVVEKDAGQSAQQPRSRRALAVSFMMFVNGVAILACISSSFVILVRRYGLTTKLVSLSIVPAAFSQIFLHLFVLKRLLRLKLGAWRVSACISAVLAAINVAVALFIAAGVESPWPFVVGNTLTYCIASLGQGSCNFLSAKCVRPPPRLANDANPSCKRRKRRKPARLGQQSSNPARLVGSIRAAFSIGNAVGPLILLEVFFRRGVAAVLFVLAALFVASVRSGVLRRPHANARVETRRAAPTLVATSKRPSSRQQRTLPAKAAFETSTT
ncbi:major facilitator superfamily domain-containing protein [Pelagophyceae sp. CCMP2097]|nr:major facilitator superfamily domain-containing protein [Pelagophyceae sp. CCMP2097]